MANYYYPPGTTPAGQPVVAQGVVQPVVPVGAPAVSAPQPRDTEVRDRDMPEIEHVKIISHTNLFYWWPVWVTGYVMALLTYLEGRHVEMGGMRETFHSNSNLGVIFFLVLFLVILITNVSVRGTRSALVILSAVLAVVLLAYFGWWDTVLNWLGRLRIHLNLGAYLAFSTLLFGVWALAVFVFDRMNYWLIKPGQITRVQVLGAGSTSYDTDGMVVEKHRSDVFRHWVLGLGSGDLEIQTTGATRDRLHLPNVLFIGSKVDAIQRLIAVKPDEFGKVTLK